jgi:hypothetical protein
MLIHFEFENGATLPNSGREVYWSCVTPASSKAVVSMQFDCEKIGKGLKSGCCDAEIKCMIQMMGAADDGNYGFPHILEPCIHDLSGPHRLIC